MLFHSPKFLFIFLPLTWIIYRALIGCRIYRVALGWLVLASLVFYGYWNPPYVLLISASILVNHFIGRKVCPALSPLSAGRRRWLLYTGLVFNLGLLGYFKYANFFLSTANSMLGTSYNFGHVILPLAISFFTFTQIAYMLDAYRGETGKYSLLEYSFFVTFFPHLIAGPIVQHYEIMPQVERGDGFRFRRAHLAVGISVFIVGLFKKMVLADGCAIYADPVFKLAAMQGILASIDCWIGVLAYTFQLYFDFSGYSDMAIGLSYCFGFRLPLNFDSPYQATSIVDFWRRWHISLSRFLKKYLYFPLGGNRHGVLMRYRNLFLTMVLGGLWHGAGWNFVIWGALHGFYLAANHLYRDLLKHWNLTAPRNAFTDFGGWALTMFAVVIAWVFFRAQDFTTASWMLGRMFGFATEVRPGLDPDQMFASGDKFLWIAFVAGLAFLAPNSHQYFSRYQPALEETTPSKIKWRPSFLHGTLLGLMVFLVALKYFSLEPTTFLYFNF